MHSRVHVALKHTGLEMLVRFFMTFLYKIMNKPNAKHWNVLNKQAY